MSKRRVADWSDEYNSQRKDLVIPEYGRHVQMLIDHAKTIENRDERQAFTEEIVKLMMQMQPQQNRTGDDLREKLWKHVFRIANYELDVTPPDTISVSPEDAHKRPDRISYPQFEARFRHYGHNVQQLIKKAIDMPEGPKRDGFIAVIGAYMKLAYKTWNKEHYVSDEVIKADLEALSEGKLVLDDDLVLENLAQPSRRRPSDRGSSGSGSNKRGGSGQHNGHSRSRQQQQQRQQRRNPKK